jgi:ABC-2 type transport system permease protein
MIVLASTISWAAILFKASSNKVSKTFVYSLFSWDTAKNIKNFSPLEARSNLIKEPVYRINTARSIANQIGETFTKMYVVEFSTLQLYLLRRLSLFIYL